ncbi:MAG: lipoate protein ligase C-terminal domain-containing protein [Candidatus Hecatellaceae archaeon]|jgi:lipoate-protein ligase A
MVEAYRHAVQRSAEGKTVRVCVSVSNGKIANVVFTGDFFAEPSEALQRLGESLQGLPLQDLAEAERRIREFFRSEGLWLMGATPEDFKKALVKAVLHLKGQQA